jgi:hypothetical protein
VVRFDIYIVLLILVMDRLLLRSPRYSEGSIRSKRGLVRYFGKTLVRWYFEVVLVLKMVVRSGIGVYTPRLSLLRWQHEDPVV